MTQFELYFSDLTEQAQEELCKKAGIEDPDEMNWDVFPITTIEFEDEDEELTDELKQQAVETFVDIAKQYNNYDDIKDRIRGLHSSDELTDAQYDYIIQEWDNILADNGL